MDDELKNELQERYLVIRNGVEVAIRLEDLTAEECNAIAEQLQREVMQEKREADMLKRYLESKYGFRSNEDTSGETKH